MRINRKSFFDCFRAFHKSVRGDLMPLGSIWPPPSLPLSQSPCVRTVNPKAFGQLHSRYALLEQAAKFLNLIIGQFRCVYLFASTQLFAVRSRSISIPASRQPQAYSVTVVFALRYVLQVLRTVIQFVAVDVVDNETLWAFANERTRNQTMNSKAERGGLCGAHSPRKACSQVSVIACAGLDYVDVANAPQVANLIVRPSRNRFPNFRVQFFGGKFLLSHDVNLRDRFANWLGSFACLNRCASRFYFSTI